MGVYKGFGTFEHEEDSSPFFSPYFIYKSQTSSISAGPAQPTLPFTGEAHHAYPEQQIQFGQMTMPTTVAVPTDKKAIRPIQIHFPESELTELRRRILATKWPDRELVPDQSQGVKKETSQALAQYWATHYDWRRFEAKLNTLPNFMTEIDGLDIHFIHVRSKHENALPIILTHGWPGSFIEMLKVIEPLTNPTAYGGTAADAFHVVIPSIPGYGFSARPTETGWGPCASHALGPS